MMDFANPSAREIYSSYLKRVGRILIPLSTADRNDITMEINSHIHEHMAAQKSNDEVAALLKSLKDLGEPEDFLLPQVAQKKLEQASHSFNPLDILSALKMNIGRHLWQSVIYTVLGLLYVFTFLLASLAVFKVVLPRNIGYFVSPSGTWMIGYVGDTTGTTDAWGYWFIPVSIVSALGLYVLLTLFLRLNRK